jgi:hypothetical protein
MDAFGSALHSAFVGAFVPYLKGILEERGLPDLSEQTFSEARQWLDERLADVLELPYPEQRRSPLEIVQEALAGPTEALSRMGVKAPLRDPVSVAAMPGDTYGLAPASSAVLGEAAFEAHLAWGMAKAQALAPLVSGQGREVLLVADDLMDRSRFEEVVHGAGLRLQPWGSETGHRPVLAFVDLTHSDADDAIKSLAAAGVRIIAYGPHVDEDSMVRAALLGADVVLPRSQLFRAIGQYLPRLA